MEDSSIWNVLFLWLASCYWTSNMLRRHSLRDSDDYALCAQEVETLDQFASRLCLQSRNVVLVSALLQPTGVDATPGGVVL
jgi:hypothetical protein